MKSSFWWGLAAILVLGLGCWAFFPRGEGDVATVRVDGKVVDQVTLSRLEVPVERVYRQNGGENRVRFSRGGAQVISADCPDQICVRRGLLSRAGQVAVCLPHRFSLSLEGENHEDAQVQ